MIPGLSLCPEEASLDALVTRSSAYRLALPKPDGSQFRVLCLLVFERSARCLRTEEAGAGADTSAGVGHGSGPPVPPPGLGLCVGCNVESTSLCSGCCAERSALSALRLRDPSAKVRKILISTDAEAFITPGAMCREYMCEHFNIWQDDVPIHLANCKGESTVVFLRKLWPSPLLYRCVPRGEMRGKAEAVAAASCTWQGERDDAFLGLYAACWARMLQVLEYQGTPEGRPDAWIEAHARAMGFAGGVAGAKRRKGQEGGGRAAAVVAPRVSERGLCHPVFYVAGAMLGDGSLLLAQQTQSVEYPCSVDAVSKLSALLEQAQLPPPHGGAGEEGPEGEGPPRRLPRLLLQMDQFGILHAPFAPARAFLSESGLDRALETYVHGEDGHVARVMHRDLYSANSCVIDWEQVAGAK